jgi:hypothetical protein
MCNFGIHTIYSCIDGFYFNSTNRRCQYSPIVRNDFVKNHSIFYILSNIRKKKINVR